MMRERQTQKAFTIVELLIVIVVIAILAAITLVAYNGIQNRAQVSKVKLDLSNARKKLEIYYAENDVYPQTASAVFVNYSTNTARTDSKCPDGTKSTDWIPGISGLPQSSQALKGAEGNTGCYIYASDGTSYVLSAWNMLDKPQTTELYRRIGFRETVQTNQFVLCNHSVIGGAAGGYTISNDYYKYSYTVTNITSCNENPPSGA